MKIYKYKERHSPISQVQTKCRLNSGSQKVDYRTAGQLESHLFKHHKDNPLPSREPYVQISWKYSFDAKEFHVRFNSLTHGRFYWNFR